MDRKGFLKLSSAAAAAGTAFYVERQMAFLQSAPGVGQPLQFYPNRGWERIYRDQYAYYSSFTFVCAPNCTHNCRLRAFVRNGVVIRTEQNYDGQLVGDLDGNLATNAWNPRGCNKGATLIRRVYRPYRLKAPLIRAGWKQWADDGFPGLTPELRTKYKFDARGTDTFVKAEWDETFTYAARGLEAVARHYSGDQGKQILLAEGYQPEMVEEVGGAGTRTFEMRGGMGLLGVMGKYGMYRNSNMMALLDVLLTRKVDRAAQWAGASLAAIAFVLFLGNGSTMRFLLPWNAGMSGILPGVAYALASGMLALTVIALARSGSALAAAGVLLLVTGGIGLQSTYQSGLVVVGLAAVAIAMSQRRLPQAAETGLDEVSWSPASKSTADSGQVGPRT